MIDHPLPSIVFALLLCGAILRLAERYYPRDFGNSNKQEQDFPDILGDEVVQESESQELAEKQLNQIPSLDPRSRRRMFLLVVGCIVLRVETLRRIAQQIECTTKNLEVRYLHHYAAPEKPRRTRLIPCTPRLLKRSSQIVSNYWLIGHPLTNITSNLRICGN